MSPEWRGELTLEPGQVSYLGPGGQAAVHQHFAVQAIRALDGTFVLELEDRDLEAEVALVPSGVPHGFRTEAEIEIVLVEADGALGRSLQSLAVQELGRDLGAALSPARGGGGGVMDLLVRSRRLPATAPTQISEVVAGAVDFIESNLTGRPTLTAAADAVHLSPSRLTHLFSEQIGIPFRRYVLWVRLRRMVQLVGEGSNLTEAALDAGFSDSSHLSRVFRENFGLPPSSLLHMDLAGDWAAGPG